QIRMGAAEPGGTTVVTSYPATATLSLDARQVIVKPRLEISLTYGSPGADGGTLSIGGTSSTMRTLSNTAAAPVVAKPTFLCGSEPLTGGIGARTCTPGEVPETIACVWLPASVMVTVCQVPTAGA